MEQYGAQPKKYPDIELNQVECKITIIDQTVLKGYRKKTLTETSLLPLKRNPISGLQCFENY